MKDKKRITTKEALAVNFHKNWLSKIRNAMGSKLTYISHVTKGGEYFIKVNLTNSSGGKDRITYKLGGSPDTLTSKDYQSLLTMLKKGEYDTGSKEPLPDTKG